MRTKAFIDRIRAVCPAFAQVDHALSSAEDLDYPAALVALIEAAVAKALDARTITGVRVVEPVVEPEAAPLAEAAPAPEVVMAPVAKGWHAGDWARLACGEPAEDETP